MYPHPRSLPQAGVPVSDPEIAALLAAAEQTRRRLVAGGGSEGSS